MTVKVYIWKGTDPDLTVYNMMGDVGHASMEIIDETKFLKKIYISHRPKSTSDAHSTTHNSPSRNNKDLVGYALKPSAEREKDDQLTFEKERVQIRKREPDVVIEINGLNENKMRELYEEYYHDRLDFSKYHIKNHNCSKVVASFIRAGLGCSQESYCSLCVPVQNVGNLRAYTYLIGYGLCFWIVRYRLWLHRQSPNNDLDFVINIILSLILTFPLLMWLYPIDIEYLLLMKISQKNFWSPRTLEIFLNKVKKHTSKTSQKMCKKKKIPSRLLK